MKRFLAREAEDCGEHAPPRPRPRGEHESVRQMAAIAEGIEEFLCRQVRRLTEVVTQCQTILTREEALRRLSETLERMRREWEVQRQQEALQIEQEHSRLIAAWESLEAEQRQLAVPAPPKPLDGDGPRFVDAALLQPMGDSSRGRRLRPEQTTADGPSHPARSETLKAQFEQLKREVENHARRARRFH